MFLETDMVAVSKMELSDIERLIPLHIQIFPDYMGTRMGKKYISKMFEWFILNSASVNLVAKNNNRIIGYVIGSPFGYRAKMIGKLLPYAFIGLIRNPEILISDQFMKIALSQICQITTRESNTGEEDLYLRKPVFSLVGIGIEAEFRGCGVGEQLMDSFSHLAFDKGFQSLRLSVHKNNNSAINFYKHLGWNDLQIDDPTLLFLGINL